MFASSLVLSGLALSIVLSRPAESQTPIGTVILQSSTPGFSQVGHTNITGTSRAGVFQGSGAGLTGVAWSSISGAPSSLPPTGAAVGDLTGTYPSPLLATSAGSLTKVSGGMMTSTGTRVGVGTTNPRALFSLGNSNTNTKLAVYDDGTGSDMYGFGIGGNQFRLHVGNSLARFSFLNSAAGTEIMTLLGTNGNLGLGTTSPGAKLHVNGGTSSVALFAGDLTPFGSAGFETNFSSSATHIWLAENGNRVASITGGGVGYFAGSLTTGGNLNFYKGWLGNSGGSPGAGQLLNVSGNAYVTFTQVAGTNGAAGGVAVGDNGSPQRALMYSNGTQGFVQANVKNFREPNELDPDTDIVYASIEGPEAAAYVRGTARLANGRAVIELPDHFKVSCLEEGMTVQLTPMSTSSKGLAVVRKGLDGIEIGELQNGTGSYDFDWEVKAIRKGYKHYAPVRPWDDALLETKMTREEVHQARMKDNDRFFKDRAARDAAQPNRRP